MNFYVLVESDEDVEVDQVAAVDLSCSMA